MPDASRASDQTPQEGIRDTLESIVVALILAFVFRAFIIEAFVIPTGSMAPTLYGAHGTIICEDCGAEFAYGLRDLADERRMSVVRAGNRAYCPNCNHANTNLDINDERRNPESGDRILVLKWPFDFGGSLLGPNRWDVVVFKDPSDGVTNFIKRLVGLPNEVLMVVDGDVYAAPTSELSAEVLKELDHLRQEKYELRMGLKRGILRDAPQFVLDELDAKLRIARKTGVARQPLWFRAYDHDHPPKSRGRHQPFWAPGLADRSGWDVSGRRVQFVQRNREEDYIELAGPPISARCSYNIDTGIGIGPHRHRDSAPLVEDLRVRFVLTPDGDSGSVHVQLTKLGRTFQATVQMNGVVSIEELPGRQTPEAPLRITARVQPLVPSRPIEVCFENVDYRLAVYVGDKDVLVSNDAPGTEGYYGPDLTALRQLKPIRKRPCRPRILAEGGDFDLTHLAVDRDVHYYLIGRPSLSSALAWAPETGWASPKSPMLLREHEYFVMGDNSAASKDSRLWDQLGPHLRNSGSDYQLGAIPRDQLIGKAFYVYWPSMQRITWLDWLPFVHRFGVIPDVGRMRWIR